MPGTGRGGDEALRRAGRLRRAARSVGQGLGRLIGRSRERDERIRDIISRRRR
jgi:hypothetical protein